MREKGGGREQLPQHSPGSVGYLSLTDSPCIQPLLGSHPTQEGTHFSARWWRLGVHTLLPPLTFHPYPLGTLASQIITAPGPLYLLCPLVIPWPSAKVCPQRGPSYSPCSHYLGIIQMEWVIRLKKIRTLSILGLVVPQLPVQGLPSIQWIKNVKGEHCLVGFAVAVSGLGLCDWPVGRRAPHTPPKKKKPAPATPFLTWPCP